MNDAQILRAAATGRVRTAAKGAAQAGWDCFSIAALAAYPDRQGRFVPAADLITKTKRGHK